MSIAIIGGISLSVAIHGAKAAWVDMVIGKFVDYGTYIGVFTAVAKVGEALLPFLPMRSIMVGLMTSVSSSSAISAAGPAMVEYGTSSALGAGMFSFLSYAGYRFHRT